MAEINPSFINTINISQEDCDKMKEQFVESKGSGAIIQLQSDDYSPPKFGDKDSVSCQVQNGLPDGKSPETAYPYCSNSVLEKGVWYKWEAGEDDSEPNVHHKVIGSLFWGDGEITENEVLSTFCWSKQHTADCTIKAFKLHE